jgi:hypothetical protein
MNVAAFTKNAEGVIMQISGTALGLAITALVFAFMRILAAVWFDLQERAAA